ncbi:MAG: hypothetical protein ACOC0P_02640, partial [Planctomycetota bacterium]
MTLWLQPDLMRYASAQPATSGAEPTDPFAFPEDPNRPRTPEAGTGGGVRGVDVAVESFGLGGIARPGSWTPIRVNVSYAGSEARSVLVVLEQRDADGDIIELTRETALNPGNNPVLLYTLMPPETLRGDTWNLVVYELDAAGDRAEQLAARVISAQNIIDPDRSVIGVVGTRTANLLDYRGPANDLSYPASGHEFIQVLSGLGPSDIPDRWMGLDMLEALVWIDGDPTQLRGERAEALAEWVARGGHFIVVLPEFDQDWLSPADLPAALRQILPEARITRWEGQTIANQSSAGGVLRHISRYARVPELPLGGGMPQVTLHLMEPQSGTWASNDVVPMMEVELTPPGAQSSRRLAVTVQRGVGLGHVTLTGIPAANQSLNQRLVDLPDAEIFWNRILGWRVDVPERGEWDFVRREEGPQQRARFDLTEVVDDFTQLAWQAEGGVLLALIVFVLYWGISGPIAFATLKKYGFAKWTWMGFVAAAAVFTVISWAGARALRTGGTEIAHFSVIDHVASGPGYQRTVTYLNADLRGYGRRLIEIDRDPADPDENDFSLTLDNGRLALEPHNTLFSFTPFGATSGGFPDVRRYTMSAAEPEQMQPYARSTAKQVVAEWVGSPLDGWQMPRPAQPGREPNVVLDNEQRPISISGVLTHNLPGTIENTRIIYVSNRRARFTPRLPQ